MLSGPAPAHGGVWRSAVMLIGVGTVMAGCGQSPAAPPATPLVLRITAVDYDCAGRLLTVTGTTEPGRAAQPVQILVRTQATSREPVWARTVASATGEFTVSAKYVPGAAPGGADITARAGAVADGVRVFSRRVTETVDCSS